VDAAVDNPVDRAQFPWTSSVFLWTAKVFAGTLSKPLVLHVLASYKSCVTGDGGHAGGNFGNAERQRATAAGKRVHETGDQSREARHGEQSQVLVHRD
jgi:hypothetical protein